MKFCCYLYHAYDNVATCFMTYIAGDDIDMSKAKKSPLNLTPGFPIQFYPEQPAMLDRIAKKKRQSKGKTVRDAVAFALENGFGG